MVNNIVKKPYSWKLLMGDKPQPTFEWDHQKDLDNQQKHGIPFAKAQLAFADPKRVILKDITHSTQTETRYFCLGEVDDGILTVRFTWRSEQIRIFGAGYWRKGRKIYVEQNQLQ